MHDERSWPPARLIAGLAITLPIVFLAFVNHEALAHVIASSLGPLSPFLVGIAHPALAFAAVFRMFRSFRAQSSLSRRRPASVLVDETGLVGSVFTLRTSRFSARTMVLTSIAAAAAAFGCGLGTSHVPSAAGFAIPLLATLLYALGSTLLFYASQRAVTVGSDGIEVREGFADRRLVRFDEVAAIESTGGAVTILTLAGARIPLLNPDRPEEAVAADLAARIDEARQRHAEIAQLAQGGANLTRVARGERSTEQWVAALRAVGAGTGHYREGAMTSEGLARLLEDPAVRLDARVGAALALRLSDDRDAERRIRVAASSTVEHELREALESVLAYDVDDEELARRLHRVR